MALEHALLIADIAHARTRPKRNAFRYSVYYLCLGLDDIPALKKILAPLKIFRFEERDHADGKPLDSWIRGILQEWNVPQANGRIVLLTMPRLFGHVFNPVSFWFCLDDAGALRAVLSEVNNTFGDRHCYISFHEDRRPITQNDLLQAEKIFHVSPFMEIKGHYQFRFAYSEEKIGVWIDHHDEDGLMLTTSLVGKRSPLNAKRLLFCFFRYPLVTLKVIGLIHYQGLKLWLKGIRYISHPKPPSTKVSR